MKIFYLHLLLNIFQKTTPTIPQPESNGDISETPSNIDNSTDDEVEKGKEN